MNKKKHARVYEIMLLILLTMFLWGLTLSAIDALEYEQTGACNHCLILKPWFNSRG